MTLYLLNALIIPSETDILVIKRKISVAKARELLSRPFVSAIGHESTATVLSRLLGIKIPFNRIQITLAPGDDAVVFSLATRLPEGKILSADELAAINYDFFLLEVDEVPSIVDYEDMYD